MKLFAISSFKEILFEAIKAFFNLNKNKLNYVKGNLFLFTIEVSSLLCAEP